MHVEEGESQLGIPVREIKGIGEKTEISLLQYFKTVNAIKEASLEELVKAIGPAKAKIVYNYFHTPAS